MTGQVPTGGTPDHPECWTIAQVAAHLGITEDAARGQMSRWRIRGEHHYPAAQVRARHAARRGSGNWHAETPHRPHRESAQKEKK